MNLKELKPRGELDKYIDNPNFDEDSQRPVDSLWETQADLTIQPRREPWARSKSLTPKQFASDGKDGLDGIDGIDGIDGTDGQQGPQGPAGNDGTDATIPSGVIVFATVPDLGDGWQLCDGTNGTPDLRGKFVVTVGTSPGANPDTYAYGDEGGFSWHGLSENNHNDHLLGHTTKVENGYEYAVSNDTVCIAGPDQVITCIAAPCCDTDIWTVDSWCGSDSLPNYERPDANNLAKHKGPYNDNEDTDNRPPFIALYAHMKL